MASSILRIKMNAKQALIDLRDGLLSGYPVCCILHYCLDSLIGNKYATVIRYVKGLEYAPCRLHMIVYHQDGTAAKQQLIQDANVII